MLIKEISEIAEVGLDKVDPVGITEVAESHSQPLSIEELYDLAQQLTEQQKEDEDEVDCGTKEMQTKDLTDILSVIDMAAEKLCDINPELGTQLYSKKLCKSHAAPLLWNPARKEKIKTVDVTFFLDVFWTVAWAFFRKIKSDLIDTFFNYLCNFLYT